MQKREIKASILIWSIFLSLILIMTFVGISTKINKNLKNNAQIIENIKNIDIPGVDLNSYTGSLKKGEIEEIKLVNSNVNISIISGGPLHYKNATSSGIISSSITGLNMTVGSLYLENLGGYTAYNINSSTNFQTQFSKYSITQEIGNKIIEKTSGEIKNF